MAAEVKSKLPLIKGSQIFSATVFFLYFKKKNFLHVLMIKCALKFKNVLKVLCMKVL